VKIFSRARLIVPDCVMLLCVCVCVCACEREIVCVDDATKYIDPKSFSGSLKIMDYRNFNLYISKFKYSTFMHGYVVSGTIFGAKKCCCLQNNNMYKSNIIFLFVKILFFHPRNKILLLSVTLTPTYFLHALAHIHTHKYTLTCRHIYTHMHKHTHKLTYTHTYAHSHVDTYSHTCI